MKLSYLLILLVAFVQCDNTPDFDAGPCKFAPPDSKFPLVEQACEECYFNLRFQDKEYSFPGNRLSPAFCGNWSQMTNVFLFFYLVPPDSDEELYSSIEIKTSLQQREAITKLDYESRGPLVSTAFGIYNYCNNFFQPITDDLSQSYHQLTQAELIESYPVGDEQLFWFYLSGELHTTFIINGEAQLVTAHYKVKSRFYEKL